MRTRLELHNRHGFVTEQYFTLGNRTLPDDLEMMLGGKDLLTVELTYKDGRRLIYHAPEYECEWCGSYEHKSDDCPNLDPEDDPPEEIAIMARDSQENLLRGILHHDPNT